MVPVVTAFLQGCPPLTAKRKKSVCLGFSQSLLCSLQIKWCCWLHQTLTSSMLWGGLHSSVKWLGWRQHLQVRGHRSPAGKHWISSSKLGVCCCKKWRGSSISQQPSHKDKTLAVNVSANQRYVHIRTCYRSTYNIANSTRPSSQYMWGSGGPNIRAP